MARLISSAYSVASAQCTSRPDEDAGEAGRRRREIDQIDGAACRLRECTDQVGLLARGEGPRSGDCEIEIAVRCFRSCNRAEHDREPDLRSGLNAAADIGFVLHWAAREFGEVPRDYRPRCVRGSTRAPDCGSCSDSYQRI